MRRPSLDLKPWPSWRFNLHDRAVRRRLLKYAAVALGLHVTATILQLPASLQHAASVGDRICGDFLKRFALKYGWEPRSYYLRVLPSSLEAPLEAAMHELAPVLARSCFARARPNGDLRSLLLGAIDLEIGSEEPARGIVLEIRSHLFWWIVADFFPPRVRGYRMSIVGYHRWQWPEVGPQIAPASDDDGGEW